MQSCIEHAFHLVLVDPNGCSSTLRALNFDLQVNSEHALAFAAALGDYLTHDAWPAATRGWAAYFASVNRHHFRALQATVADAESALACFKVCGLSVGIACALAQLGDTVFERGLPGDAEQALVYYQQSLDIRESLLANSPDNAMAARDVSVSLLKLADFLARRGLAGDAEQALAFYQRSLEILERLLAANPDSAEAARDVSVSLDRLGDFLARRGQTGDAQAALGHYQRSLEILERLLAANPDSAQAARDESVSLIKLADFLASRGQTGDAQAALGHYQRCLEVREALLLSNPNSAQAARDVSVGLERLAETEAQRPDGAARALALQLRSLEIALQLRERNPASWFYQRTAAVAYLLSAQRAQAADNQELTTQCLGGCYAVLDPLIQAGVEIDADMRGLHAELAPQFAKRATQKPAGGPMSKLS